MGGKNVSWEESLIGLHEESLMGVVLLPSLASSGHTTSGPSLQSSEVPQPKLGLTFIFYDY